MDPRLLLGVSVRAGRAEVRAAHRRLRRAVDPVRGGTDELVRIVDAAAGALTGSPGGSGALLREPDPRRVLGVGVTATRDEVRAAYRRVAPAVHPDRGGTDELFRLVEGARRALLSRPAADDPGAWSTWRPPAPPPPRGPYRAPPPEERHSVPTWRAVRDLAWYLSVLASAAVVVFAGFSLGPVLGGVTLAALTVAALVRAPVLRPAFEGALRAVIVLLGSRVRVPDAVAPERFLEQSCLDAPVGRAGEQELYVAYVRWCATRPAAPVAPWVFAERLRTLGLLLVKPSAWDAGLWVGITLRRDP